MRYLNLKILDLASLKIMWGCPVKVGQVPTSLSETTGRDDGFLAKRCWQGRSFGAGSLVVACDGRSRSRYRKIMVKTFSACAMVAALLPAIGVAQSGSVMSELAQRVDEFRDEQGIPGLAVGVLRRGEIVFIHASGLRAKNQPATATDHTLFSAASISKTLTATAILQLVADGELKLDQPVGEILDEFERQPITIRHLLTHTSGLHDRPSPGDRRSAEEVQRYLERLADRELWYAPGTEWSYSDSGFNVLGSIIERLRGEPFGDVMRERVLEPLGITRGGFLLEQRDTDAALPHRDGFLGVRLIRDPDYDRAFLPSSGLHVSVRDLLRWADATLSRDDRLLPPEMFEVMLEGQHATSWDGVEMALGWQLELSRFGRLPRHAGDAGGMSSLLTLYPDDEVAIAILTNREDAPRWQLRSLIENALLAQGLLSD